jgi:hypothetical protein
VTADASQSLAQTTYVISARGPMSLTVTDISSNYSSPRRAGTTIRFTADASGGDAPYQYKWWVYDGSAWSVAQDWTYSASMNWQPSRSGTYIVAVWVRNDGSTADASEALGQVQYVVTP